MSIRPSLCLGILLVVGVYAVSANWHIFHGALNPDEGFYAVATRAVAEGEVPYRDFGFTQPPLVLYANCLPLSTFGFGLFQQRQINGVWAAAALLLAAVWLGRATRPGWGLALVMFFALSSPWMYFMHLGKTYGFTTLLVMVATWIFLQVRLDGWRGFLLGLLAVGGVGARLPAAPFFGLLWLFAVFPGRVPKLKEAGFALSGIVLGLAIIATPFYLAGLESTSFWIFKFHQISVPQKNWHLQWQEIVTLAPAAWVLALAACVLIVQQGRHGDRRTAVFAAAVVGLSFNLLPGGVYEEYAVPFLLPMVITAAALLHGTAPARWRLGEIAMVGILGMVQLTTTPLLYHDTLPQRRWSLNAWLPFNVPEYNRHLPEQLSAARLVIAKNLAPQSPFIGSNLILAAETKRTVPSELRMGPFALTQELPTDMAARLHLATTTELDHWLDNPQVTTIAYFPNARLNYSWSMPSFALVPDAERSDRFARILQSFDVKLAEGDFLLLVRKPVP